jgi:DNA-binding MarR family transcriptional regulator
MADTRGEPRLFGALFRIPFQILDAKIEQGLAERGFTELRPAHFDVFRYLDPGGSRSTDLAEQARITKQSMGYLIDYLEEHGYVTRVPDPADRRAKLVQLTERGEAAEQTARQIIRRTEREWAEMLGGDKLAQVRATLERLITLLEE